MKLLGANCVFSRQKVLRGRMERGQGVMESAAELHEARVLRAQIELREAELRAAELRASGPEDRVFLAEELSRLRRDYRRVLARQADADYQRRRAEWRADSYGSSPARRACA